MLVVPSITSLTAAAAGQGVIPDVIDYFEPSVVVMLSYGSKEAHAGTTLKPEEAKDIPRVQVTPLKKLDPKDRYTLLVTDPDAPSRSDNKWSEYAHYAVSGLTITADEGESQELDLSSGNTILPYVGPGPPPKTGLHRYVALLYREGGKTPEAPADRPSYGTGQPGYGAREWSTKHGLTPLGLNFFLSQNKEN